MRKINLTSTCGVIFSMRYLNLSFIALLSFLTLSVVSCSKSDGLSTSGLRCENLNDPFGINTLQPRFSWKNSSDRQGASQSAYQILVGSDADKLKEGEADFWDSGKVESSQSIVIEYQGKLLRRCNQAI